MDSGSYVVVFAGSHVTIDWRGTTSLEILKFLYPGVGSDPRSGGTVEIESQTKADSTEIVIRQGEGVLYRGLSKGTAAVTLMDWCSHELAAGCRVGPLFHAAAVALGGRGIMLPGESGSGKSTLAAFLAHSGFNCLTDEMTCPAGEALTLDSFPRPIHLKGRSGEVLEGLGCIPRLTEAPRAQRMQSELGSLIPISLLNGRNVLTKPRLELIVFPRYAAGSELRVVRLSKAEAGLLLMKNAVNVRNLPGHGFEAVAGIAGRVPSYELSYNHFEGVVAVIEEMLSAPD